MKFWNNLGEFFLFRWVWKRFTDDHQAGNRHNSRLGGYSEDELMEACDFDPNEDYEVGSAYRGQSFDDFMEEQDDWDMMDDGI